MVVENIEGIEEFEEKYDWDKEVERGIVMRHDNTLDKYNERELFVEKVVEAHFDEYELGMKMLVVDDRQFSQQKVPKAIDWLGTYLLKSKDIVTCRRLGEYTFYYDEKDMKRGKIASNTISVDLEASRNLHGNKSVFDEPTYLERMDYLVKRLRLNEMDLNQKKKLIRMGLKYKDKAGHELQETMKDLYQVICGGVWKDSDVEVIDLLVLGYKEKEITELLGGTQQNMHKKIDRIVDRIGKWEDE